MEEEEAAGPAPATAPRGTAAGPEPGTPQVDPDADRGFQFPQKDLWPEKFQKLKLKKKEIVMRPCPRQKRKVLIIFKQGDILLDAAGAAMGDR